MSQKIQNASSHPWKLRTHKAQSQFRGAKLKDSSKSASTLTTNTNEPA